MSSGQKARIENLCEISSSRRINADRLFRPMVCPICRRKEFIEDRFSQGIDRANDLRRQLNDVKMGSAFLADMSCVHRSELWRAIRSQASENFDCRIGTLQI